MLFADFDKYNSYKFIYTLFIIMAYLYFIYENKSIKSIPTLVANEIMLVLLSNSNLPKTKFDLKLSLKIC